MFLGRLTDIGTRHNFVPYIHVKPLFELGEYVDVIIPCYWYSSRLLTLIDAGDDNLTEHIKLIFATFYLF